MPDGPAIVIANEFLDALPIRQLVFGEDGWRERVVELDAAGALRFAIGDKAAHARAAPAAPAGAILELRAGEDEVLAELGRRTGPCVALFIDYGPAEPAYGDTLQAVRRHAYVDPLATPGAADLTAHVQFAALADKARRAGLAADGPITQAEFLGALGIAERTSRLMAANPERAGAIETATQRLVSPTGMGSLFKVLAVRSPASSAPAPVRLGLCRCRSPSPPTVSPLSAPAGIRHGFFTRHGGVSRGGYASLNCGLGSRDDPAAVAENRTRVSRFLDAHSLLTAHQVHSPTAVVVDRAWSREERPRADAIVTATPGIALGVLTADCAPVLFADPQARVVAAAHAGWRGAIGGVLEATLAAMEGLGARRDRIGPPSAPASCSPTTRWARSSSRSSSPATRAARHSSRDRRTIRRARPHFDLPGYVLHRLKRAGTRSRGRGVLHLCRGGGFLQLSALAGRQGE